jgi:hypothetical protein
MSELHDIIVKVGLTADQYITFHNIAKDNDLKDAQLLRQLILKNNREVAIRQLSADAHDLESTDLVLTRG